MKKIIAIIIVLSMLVCNIPVSFAEADMTEYTSFNLWYTPDTHVKKGETIPLIVKDGEGNVLNSENADLSFKSLNPAVATVNANGNVKGVNPGIAVISAKLSNNKTELPEAKIMITVRTGKEVVQSFEGVADDAWPTTKPRMGERSYIVSSNGGSLSTTSYKNSADKTVDGQNLTWGSGFSPIVEAWFYDDCADINAAGPAIKIMNQHNTVSLFSMRMSGTQYYGQSDSGHKTTSNNEIINTRKDRSIGWHQVIFDMSMANKGDGTGERSIYIDGELIYKQLYTFDSYTEPRMAFITSNSGDLSGAMYYDDMSVRDVARDKGAVPVIMDTKVHKVEGFLYGGYSYFDANGAMDTSVIVWQISDERDGIYTDMSGDTSGRYEIKPEDEGKYIRIKVTPANATGESVCSAPIGPIKAEDNRITVQGTALLIESSTVKMGNAYTYGRCDKIEARNGSKPYKGFLKFDISDIDMEKMKSAVLRLYLIEQQSSSVDANITASLVTGEWSEDTLNRDNVPEVSQNDSVSFKIKRRYAWYEVDVYSIIKNAIGDDVSFCITSDCTNGTAYFCGMDSIHPAEIVFYENEYVTKKEYDFDSAPDSMVDYKLVKAGRYYDSEKYDYKTRLVENVSGYTKIIKAPKTDVFGGYYDKRFNQTGKFHLEIDENDRWWLVDPFGNGFISKGVNYVNVGNNTEEEAEAFNKKYTSSARMAEWAQDTKGTLIENGFNTLGGWASRNLFFTNTKAYMPYMVTWNIMSQYMEKTTQPFSTYLPVFDEAFRTFSQEYINENLTQILIADPYMIGITTDNELAANFFLQNYLNLDKEKYPESYNAAWEWFKERHGEDAVLDDMTFRDIQDFRGYVFETYYKLMSELIKERAPQALYLGSRLNNNAPYTRQIIEAAGKYCDILTVNYYGFWTPEHNMIDKWTEWSGRPFIITEFYAKGPANNCDNSNGAGFTVETQKARGEFYQNYTISLLENKNCIGYHWFSYRDETNKNCGIVDRMFNNYTELLSYMKEANDNALGILEYFDSMGNKPKAMYILTPLSYLEDDDGSYKYKAVFYNNTDTEQEAAVTVATYDENRLVNVKCGKILVPPGKYMRYQDCIAAGNIETPKGFVWKSYESMIPLDVSAK